VKIGIFGGTFDPIHLGHLRAAENARETLRLDSVHFVPVGAPPHRTGPRSTTIDRYAMVALATAAHPGFVASDVEIRREGPSYTIDTVLAFREAFPQDELVLIVGSDTYAEIPTWRDPDRIFSHCHIAVVHRPGESPKPPEKAFDVASQRVSWVETAGLPISATDVRRRVSQGQSPRYLVSDAVADYIQKRALYR
jgi:nicotinate-nucleotide adenylyltransferase